MAPKQLQKGARRSAAGSSDQFGNVCESSGKAVPSVSVVDPSEQSEGKGVKKQVHWKADQRDVDGPASFSSSARERLRNQRIRIAELRDLGGNGQASSAVWKHKPESSYCEEESAEDKSLTISEPFTVLDVNASGSSTGDFKDLPANSTFDETDPFAVIKFPEELSDSEQLLKESLEIHSLAAKLIQEYNKCETETKQPRIPIPQEVVAATEEAKRLVKSGTMTVQKTEQRTTFKRPVKLARRLEKVGNGFVLPKQAGSFDSGFDYSVGETIFSGRIGTHSRPSDDDNYYGNDGPVPSKIASSSEKNEAESSNRSVYIRSSQVSEESIRNCFSKFGTIVGIKCGIYDKSAIVDFETSDAAFVAVEQMNGSYIDGLPLTVSIANAQLCRAFNEYPPFLSDKQKDSACPDERNVVHYGDEET
uniref:Negative elongation factor E n=1 Tax=Trichuris muris TaxID=70415 RepID=A0A5S6QHM4_TRIMR